MTSMFAVLTGALLTWGGGGPVTGVAITPEAGQTSVLIAVTGDTQYRDFTMEGPNRLVVDLMGARQALPQGEYPNVNRGGIVSIHSSQYSADIVRVVFTLQKLVDYSIARDTRGIRITLENPQGSFAPWAAGSAGVVPGSAAVPAAAPVKAAARTEAPERIVGALQQSQERHITVTFTNSPIENVLLQFSQYSGRSIIPGTNVSQAGLVTADIHDEPWDVALKEILASRGLVATEDSSGIIRVDNIQSLADREKIEPIVTTAHRINYATAQELQAAVQPLLTSRGKVTVGTSTNTLIVSDIQRVQTEVNHLLVQLDRRTPQVAIQSKIIFVNRTDLQEMGVSYELKDSRGNQLNQLSSGEAVVNGKPTTIPQGQAVVLLGGNSIAALGNAFSRVPNPTLTLLSSLVVGRHQLISFLDALQSANLSDVQASPQVTTLDNVQARMMVGQIIPVRVIEAGTGATGQGTFPTAQVTTEQTGIILQATPHVTSTGNILLDLSVERSSAQPATSDAGFIKNTQQGSTRVLVKDGETVMLAGLTQSEKTEVSTGIPLLMNLPVIGGLFRHSQHQTVQQDLIILVTPHIVQSPG